MKVRIVGDGTFKGTRLETMNGEQIEMVSGVEFRLDSENQIAEAKVTFLRPHTNVVVEAPGLRLAEDPE